MELITTQIQWSTGAWLLYDIITLFIYLFICSYLQTWGDHTLWLLASTVRVTVNYSTRFLWKSSEPTQVLVIKPSARMA